MEPWTSACGFLRVVVYEYLHATARCTCTIQILFLMAIDRILRRDIVTAEAIDKIDLFRI
jgi:hypothetical protein